MYSLSPGKNKITNKEKTIIISELRQTHKFKFLLVIAEVPKSVYYYHFNNLNNPNKYENIKVLIQEIYDSSKGRYGYRRITLAIKNKGIVINHKTVSKIMKELGIVCQVRMKKYKSYKGEVGKTTENLLKRDFVATKPLQKCATDITEFSLFGVKLYLSPIIDLYNGEIVSYEISERAILSQVDNMLDKLYTQYEDEELKEMILHSDQGWQYQHTSYQKSLKKHGIRQSMSRKGNCLDNAVMENFFGLLKSELLYLQNFNGVEHFISELHEYIRWYNEERIKVKLKGLSPIQFRTQSLAA